MVFTETRFKSTGNELSEWSPDKFRDVVYQHVDAAWGDPLTRFKFIFGAVLAVGSAALNLWFLTSTMLTFQRNSEEDYNLTEWIVSLVEMIILYFFVVYVLISVIALIRNSTKSIDFAHDMVDFVSGIYSVCIMHILTMSK